MSTVCGNGEQDDGALAIVRKPPTAATLWHSENLKLLLLVSHRTQEWIHLEAQAIDAMDFRFSSKGDPIDYVSYLAGNMQVAFPRDFQQHSTESSTRGVVN